MIKFIFIPLITIFALFFYYIPTVQSDQKGDIIWKNFILPPVNIVEGRFAGNGYAQNVAGDLTKFMPQYNHVWEYGSFSTVISDLRSRPRLCTSGLKKTQERQNFLIYSEPVYVYIQARLAVRSDASGLVDGFVDENGQVDLSTLWRDTDMNFAFVPGRRHGPVIDDFISAHRDYSPGRFWKHDSPLRLLEGRRVHAAFLTPPESQFEIIENNYDLSLKFYDIKGSVPLSPAHIACVRSEWGERVIQQIDTILKTTDVRERGIDYFAEWISDDMREWYRSEARLLLNQ